MEPIEGYAMKSNAVRREEPPPLTLDRRAELIGLAQSLSKELGHLNPRELAFFTQTFDLLTNPHRY